MTKADPFQHALAQSLAVSWISLTMIVAPIGGQPALADDIPFETIEKGSHSGYEEGCGFLHTGSEVMIRYQAEWERFWELHASNSPAILYRS